MLAKLLNLLKQKFSLRRKTKCYQNLPTPKIGTNLGSRFDKILEVVLVTENSLVTVITEYFLER